jgi:hypothetical protein
MRQIAAGSITRADAAARLRVSERHVNRLMRAHGVSRPAGKAHERRVTAQAHREAKERAARGALQGVHSLENAAMQAGCSLRTMYRWVKKLKNAVKMSKKRRKSR